uniref:Ovule protein n=1 Tax=Hydatigena taeniaeformis TaxID=6205 RepID=A0A0R3X864_HYDTA
MSNGYLCFRVTPVRLDYPLGWTKTSLLCPLRMHDFSPKCVKEGLCSVPKFPIEWKRA